MAARSGKSLFEPICQQMTVREAGQRIMIGSMLEFLARTALVRDVMKYQDVMRAGTTAASHGRCNRADPYSRAILLTQAESCARLFTCAHCRV